jgi:hypothetical protein
MRSILYALLLLGSGAANAAPVRYDYLGQEFTAFNDFPEVEGTYAPGMRVSGYFVLAEALSDNTGVSIEIADMIDFSFSDGRNTITGSQTNLPTSIFLRTDSNGVITNWDINLSTSFTQPEPDGLQSWQLWTRTNFDGSSSTDIGMTSECAAPIGGSGPCFSSYDDSANVFQGTPGIWTATVVPIPAAVWLFGSALAGLGWQKRKKSVSA